MFSRDRCSRVQTQQVQPIVSTRHTLVVTHSYTHAHGRTVNLELNVPTGPDEIITVRRVRKAQGRLAVDVLLLNIHGSSTS